MGCVGCVAEFGTVLGCSSAKELSMHLCEHLQADLAVLSKGLDV